MLQFACFNIVSFHVNAFTIFNIIELSPKIYDYVPCFLDYSVLDLSVWQLISTNSVVSDIILLLSSIFFVSLRTPFNISFRLSLLVSSSFSFCLSMNKYIYIGMALVSSKFLTLIGVEHLLQTEQLVVTIRLCGYLTRKRKPFYVLKSLTFCAA